MRDRVVARGERSGCNEAVDLRGSVAADDSAVRRVLHDDDKHVIEGRHARGLRGPRCGTQRKDQAGERGGHGAAVENHAAGSVT